MRAAIAAFDAGVDRCPHLEDPSAQPSGSGREAGINAALGNASEDDPEKRAVDTRQGLRTLSTTRTRSRACDEARGTSTSWRTAGAVFSRTEDGHIARRPSAPPASPAPAYAADITAQVLVHVLYEQVMKRHRDRASGSLEARRGRRALPGRHLLGSPERRPEARRGEDGDPGYRWGRPALRGATNAYSCTGDGMALALRMGVPPEGHGDDAVPPDHALAVGVLITEDRRGEGAYLLNSEASGSSRTTPNAMELASRDVISRPSRSRSTRAAAWTATSCSTCVIWAPRRSSRVCTGRERGSRSSPRSTRSTSRGPCGRARITTWGASTPTSTARRPSRASTPPASAHAALSTAPTGWAGTR